MLFFELWVDFGVLLIFGVCGTNDGGCRGLDLFWGYLDDAYFPGWATLESSLEIFDLHKSTYKGNNRKVAIGHFLLSDYSLFRKLFPSSNLCLNRPAVCLG